MVGMQYSLVGEISGKPAYSVEISSHRVRLGVVSFGSGRFFFTPYSPIEMTVEILREVACFVEGCNARHGVRQENTGRMVR